MKKTVLFFWAVIILISCNQRNTKSIELSQTSEIDTAMPVIYTDFKSAGYPEIFESAFSDNTSFIYGTTKYLLRKYDIGKIKIESGKIIACDPIVMHDAKPFTQVFPKGLFEVDLAISKASDDHRVAFSRILFSTNPVTKWEFALKEGQKPISLTTDSSYCYGVDGGTGIFIDSVANNFFSNLGQPVWEQAFIQKMQQDGYKGYIYAFGEHNLATFATGYGDGCYSTFIGRDSTGNACQLLTDFGLIPWWKIQK